MKKMNEIRNVSIRNLQISDFAELKETMEKAYKDIERRYLWTEKEIEILLGKFPEGQLVVVVDQKVVGCAFSLIIYSKQSKIEHTYNEITANDTFETHNPGGDILYGIDVFIDPDYRGLRLGRRLYDRRKELCEQLNLKAIQFGGRIPNYQKYSNQYSPKEYIEKVKQKEIQDPVLNFQISNDFHVKKILKNYLEGDEKSKEYGILLEWNNIYYTEEDVSTQVTKSSVRIGLIQWQMRSFDGLAHLYEQMEFFVDAVSGYNSDFALFPEFFNAPLMAEFNHLPEYEAIRRLADFTVPIKEKFQEFAISYNINIITGSMPFIENDSLYNVGYLCHRNGKTERFTKLHITPNELSYWGMSGGDKVRIFNTDAGKIGILICYDVEFPELSRILAMKGMQILFVPFLTDTQNGFTRVKRCAQARAIENECYVAIAGCVGNLPKVNNMDIQFAESGVYTPADFPFPTDGVKAKATPNTEMTLIVDTDLDLLKELHTFGSVRNLNDRRTDIYQLTYKKAKKIL